MAKLPQVIRISGILPGTQRSTGLVFEIETDEDKEFREVIKETNLPTSNVTLCGDADKHLLVIYIPEFEP